MFCKCCLPAFWWPCCSRSVFQRRKWRGWQRCALIRWFQEHTRLPFGGGANSPPWDVCSNPGNGGRRRVKRLSRPLRVRPTLPLSPSSSPLPPWSKNCLTLSQLGLLHHGKNNNHNYFWSILKSQFFKTITHMASVIFCASPNSTDNDLRYEVRLD